MGDCKAAPPFGLDCLDGGPRTAQLKCCRRADETGTATLVLKRTSEPNKKPCGSTGFLPITSLEPALMLGVRRAGVTIALQHFESRAVIAMARGAITVQDRDGLEECANGLHGAP